MQVKMTGKWEDETEFEAYDRIRVIEPGKRLLHVVVQAAFKDG